MLVTSDCQPTGPESPEASGISSTTSPSDHCDFTSSEEPYGYNGVSEVYIKHHEYIRENVLRCIDQDGRVPPRPLKPSFKAKYFLQESPEEEIRLQGLGDAVDAKNWTEDVELAPASAVWAAIQAQDDEHTGWAEKQGKNWKL